MVHGHQGEDGVRHRDKSLSRYSRNILTIAVRWGQDRESKTADTSLVEPALRRPAWDPRAQILRKAEAIHFKFSKEDSVMALKSIPEHYVTEFETNWNIRPVKRCPC